MPDMPDLDRLRAWADWNDQDPYSTGGPAEEAVHFLLSVAKSGGRLVLKTPCEHGVFHDSCDQLVCGHDHLLTDGWYPDARAECWCPGGSRMQVWPADKEPEEGTDATTQDLVEAVQSIGGEVLATSDSYVGATRPLAYGDSRIVVREPGRYLVLRLPDEEE